MSEKVIAVGGIALVSLAALSFSKHPESSASAELKIPEPIVAPLSEGDPWSGECRLPAPSEARPDITCALPAGRGNNPPHIDLSAPNEIFPAPITIDSKVVAEVVEGLRAFRLDRVAAAEIVAKHLVTLSAHELQKECNAARAAYQAESALALGAPTRDTNFLRGVEAATQRAIDAHAAARSVAHEELAAIITAAM